MHGTLFPDPQRSRFADVTGRGSSFSLHLSVEEYKFIIQPETGRSPLPLLSSLCRLAQGYFSCMVDILLNTSFLDDMGDHSKSKLNVCYHCVDLLRVFHFSHISVCSPLNLNFSLQIIYFKSATVLFGIINRLVLTKTQ